LTRCLAIFSTSTIGSLVGSCTGLGCAGVTARSCGCICASGSIDSPRMSATSFVGSEGARPDVKALCAAVAAFGTKVPRSRNIAEGLSLESLRTLRDSILG